MIPVVRTLLIWLLVLALPAQGAVAATMALCGPNHHDTAGATPVVAAVAALSTEHPHDAAPAHPPSHAHSTAHAVPTHHDNAADAGAGVSSSAADPEAQAKAQSCSVCAACCSMGAITGGLPPLPVADSATTTFPALGYAVDAFTTEGPDRPPRVVLA